MPVSEPCLSDTNSLLSSTRAELSNVVDGFAEIRDGVKVDQLRLDRVGASLDSQDVLGDRRPCVVHRMEFHGTILAIMPPGGTKVEPKSIPPDTIWREETP